MPVEFVRSYPGVWNALEQEIWVERQVGQSLFRQAYRLQAHSPVLRIETEVDWQERHVLVKAAFPLNLEADFATYEVPFGAMQRTTRRESDRQRAQWEVPALRWADLGDGEYGVSVLNDCKYGYDSEPGRLRLTLLRGAEWPNPEADLGVHRFSYGLYGHGGDWRSAQTVRQGYEFNQALRVVKLVATEGKIPAIGQFFDLSNENLIVTAFKQSEDDSKQWILRCYECHGESIELHWAESSTVLSSCLDMENPQCTNLLETKTVLKSNEISPWKIATFLFSGLEKLSRILQQSQEI
jgi:alpha-mannosidase